MTWAWPRDWPATVLPRRTGGGALGGALPVPPSRAGDGRADLGKAISTARTWLAGPGHATHLHEAATAVLDGPPAGWTPLGVAATLTPALHPSTGDRHDRSSVVDHLLDAYGTTFTACVLAELAGMDMDHLRGHGWVLVPFTGWNSWDPHAPWAGLARMLRIRLVSVPDIEYVRAVAALASYRDGLFTQRALASYLAPDQAAWVAADCADAQRSGDRPEAYLLFGAASTAEQFRQVSDVRHAGGGPGTVSGVATLLDVLGVDAVPVLARWADRCSTRAELEPIWTALAALPADAAFQALVERASDRYAMPYVRRGMEQAPERALRVLATTAATGGDLLRDLVVTRPDVAEHLIPQLPDDRAARIREHLRTNDSDNQVPEDELAAVLHRPPWTMKRPKPVVVAGLVAPDEAAMAWAPGEREKRSPRFHRDLVAPSPEAVRRLVAGRLHPRNLAARALAEWPESVVRPVLDRITVAPSEYTWDGNEAQWALALRFGVDALPIVLATARTGPRYNAEPLLPFAATEVAVAMADWFDRLTSVRPVATAWFTRHPGVTARALVPPALGRPGKGRRQAERVLRWLAGSGFDAEVRAAGAGYGPAVAAGIGALLDSDPLGTVPTGRVPALPAWLDARVLPPLRVPDGRVLPAAAVAHVCTVLAMSTVDEPHPALEIVRATCDPASLEGFVWAVFDRWAADDHPARERWALTALALAGGDDTVERLVPLVETWPSVGAQARALIGLDILCAVGTDRALMHLDRFSRKARTSTLRYGAQQRIQAVAQARELTPEQLADRLVPDFDLDSEGRMTLDYGPRQFVVGFDELLRPFVADTAGNRLTALPRPGAKDDPDRAAAGYKRFSTLKRTVRTVAAEQVRRFERAMVWRRRWSADEVAALFVAHPLLQHLARRLVWSTDGGGSFRVAEDGTYADAADDPYEVPAGARIGVAHPLDLATDLPAWTEIFGDYGIGQPFPQLARETYGAAPVDAFLGRTTTGGRALGLRSRGWEIDDPDRWGRVFTLRLPEGYAHVEFDPGMEFITGFDPKAKQAVRSIGVTPSMEALGPVSRSEVLRDLNHVLG